MCILSILLIKYNLVEINKKYNKKTDNYPKHIYIIEYYNKIRYFEEDTSFSIPDRNKFSKNAKNLQKTFDISRAISYINEQYRSVYKSKPGGLNSVLKRLRAKQQED